MVWGVNSSLSIIVEYCKGKQTNLHSHSLRNQTLRHIHSIAYNNIYSLTPCGKGIAFILRWILNEIKIDIGNNQNGVLIYEKDDVNHTGSSESRSKPKDNHEMGGCREGCKGKKGL